jgi:CheY-like chemotaxis protein
MQLLGNLITNAIKYTHQGSIRIGCNCNKNNDIEFFVNDTGIGIPAEKHSIIFEQFRQADDSHTRLYGGVGLGLSICSEIATMLGGEITLDSEQGKGSNFSFILSNALVGVKPAAQATAKAKNIVRFDGKTILLVDDLDDNLYLLELMLSPTGAAVLRASDGPNALKMVEMYPEIDLVLMDIKMPEMDGYDAMTLVHRIRPGLPVVAQTAFAIPGDREYALQKGCAGYLAKPIKKDILLAEIQRVLAVK